MTEVSESQTMIRKLKLHIARAIKALAYAEAGRWAEAYFALDNFEMDFRLALKSAAHTSARADFASDVNVTHPTLLDDLNAKAERILGDLHEVRTPNDHD